MKKKYLFGILGENELPPWLADDEHCNITDFNEIKYLFGILGENELPPWLADDEHCNITVILMKSNIYLVF